jgi:hypothetical protein
VRSLRGKEGQIKGKKNRRIERRFFQKERRRITSSLLSFLQQVLQEQQALRQQAWQHRELEPVRAQERVKQQEPAQERGLLLFCHRQRGRGRAGRRRGFAWSWFGVLLIRMKTRWNLLGVMQYPSPKFYQHIP